MSRLFGKHEAGVIPDWQQTSPTNWTVYQKIANKTYGVITPGNLITISGLALSISGLKDLDNANYVRGTTKLFFSELSDAIDGAIAEYTNTKSSVGRILDPTIDKAKILVALPTILNHDLIPKSLSSIIIAQESEISLGALKLISEGKSDKIQPNWAGKTRILLERLAVGSCLVGKCLEEIDTKQDIEIFRKIGIALGLGSAATAHVAKRHYKKILAKSSDES